ncbi:antibiotic biosynthesis monooxygenase family protein [Chloroflexota bacterium]
MYAQLVMFPLGQGMRSEAEQIADKFYALHKDIKGFRSATFLGDDANGNYGSLTTWETPEELQAAGDILRPKLQEALSGIAKGAPTVQIFEVYEPKG